MAKAISSTRKSRGRPSTGAESVHLRILPEQLKAIDAWVAVQKEPVLTRPEAIRRLIDAGLAANPKRRKIRASDYVNADMAQVGRISRLLEAGNVDAALKEVGLDPTRFRTGINKAVTEAFGQKKKKSPAR